MAFLETPHFPEDIAAGAVGGPGYSTSIAFLPGSGRELRNINRQDGLGSWDVAFGARNQTQMNALLAFFRIAKGRGNGFRFKDPMDFSATASQGVLVQLTSTTWQMYKRYTSGSSTEDRIIQKPRSATVAVTGTGSYSVDYTTGIITKLTGAAPTAWAGQFDVPCRFDIDQMKAGYEALELYTWGQIPVIEVVL